MNKKEPFQALVSALYATGIIFTLGFAVDRAFRHDTQGAILLACGALCLAVALIMRHHRNELVRKRERPPVDDEVI